MRNSKRRGFTLIELMIVLSILILLAGVGVVAYMGQKESANKQTATILVKGTCEAIDLYYTQMGRYPTSEEGLKALIEAPTDEKLLEKWKNNQHFLTDDKIPVDPWNNELKYEFVQSSDGASTGRAYHVWSMGPDGQDNTEDDIRSWTEAK